MTIHSHNPSSTEALYGLRVLKPGEVVCSPGSITLALKKRRVDELLAHLAGMPF